MKYKREEIIEKIVADYLNESDDTIRNAYEEMEREKLSVIDNETLLSIADGRSITTEEDEIEERVYRRNGRSNGGVKCLI